MGALTLAGGHVLALQDLELIAAHVGHGLQRAPQRAVDASPGGADLVAAGEWGWREGAG